MFDINQLNQFKQFVNSCNRLRNVYRQKYCHVKYDVIIDNGNSVHYACLRFIAIIPHLNNVQKYKNRKYAVIAIRKLKEIGCYDDYKKLSKNIPLHLEDIKLRDEYLSLMKITIKKLKDMEKNKDVNIR